MSAWWSIFWRALLIVGLLVVHDVIRELVAPTSWWNFVPGIYAAAVAILWWERDGKQE